MYSWSLYRRDSFASHCCLAERPRWIVCHSSRVKFVESTCSKISLQRHKLSSSLPSPTQVYLAWSVAILILHATFLEFQSFLNVGNVCPWEQQNFLDFRTINTYCMQYGAVILAQMRYIHAHDLKWCLRHLLFSFSKCTWYFFSQIHFDHFALFCRLGTNLRTLPSQETNLSKFFCQLHQLVNYVVR